MQHVPYVVIQCFLIFIAPPIQRKAMWQDSIVRVCDNRRDTMGPFDLRFPLPGPCSLYRWSSSYLVLIFCFCWGWFAFYWGHSWRFFLVYSLWSVWATAHRGSATQLVGGPSVQPSAKIRDEQGVLHIGESGQCLDFGVCFQLAHVEYNSDHITHRVHPTNRLLPIHTLALGARGSGH